VKCRKCGDGIVVFKDGASASAPPAPGGDGSFDLGSAVRDSAGESSGSPPPGGNLIPFPAPTRPTEPGASEKDEVDLAFDRFLSGDAEASVPLEPDAPAGPGPRPEPNLGAFPLDIGPGEKPGLPSAAAPERPFGGPSAADPTPEFRGEGGFMISDSDTLDFLQEKHPDAASESPGGVGDISLEISSAPVDEMRSFLRDPDASPTPREDWSSPPPVGVSFEKIVTPPSTPVIDVPPYREVEPPPARTVESPVRRGSPAPESPRPRSSAGPAVAAVLAVLLAAGGYLGLTASGRKTLEGAVPGIAALWGGKPAAPAAPKYDFRNVIGYYESGGASPRILVIKGQVVNLSTVDKSGIRVHAALLDNTDAVLVQQAVYAGNVLSGEAIRKGDRDSLSKALGNRFGEGLANMSVAPGKVIPFMVLFFDAPATMDSYKLEAKDGE
jgi:hypothetical protein